MGISVCTRFEANYTTSGKNKRSVFSICTLHEASKDKVHIGGVIQMEKFAEMS